MPANPYEDGSPVVWHPTPAQPIPELDPVAPPETAPDSPSRLDPVEISTGRIRNPDVPPLDDAGDDAVQSFRHSFWRERRVAIRAALVACGQSDQILERFDRCGSNCWVMKARDQADRFRLAADRCHNRWCEACATERRRLISKNVIAGLREADTKGDRLRFVTLTLKHNDEPLRNQLDRIYRCWRAFKDRREIKSRIFGTLSFFEVKISKKDGRWHPHLHILIDGHYIAKQQISDLWLEITGDTFIVDIHQVKNPEHAAGYVAKYAAKSIDHAVWRDPNRLQEAMAAFTNRRLFNASGTFRKMHLSKPPPDDCDWQPVCTLRSLIDAARQGDLHAGQILRSLGGSYAAEPIDAFHSALDPPQMPDLPV